jgi:hypothetical protein
MTVNVFVMKPKKTQPSASDVMPAEGRLEEQVTAELRWNNGTLQQKWMIFQWDKPISDDGSIRHVEEWRDVPVSGGTP